MAKSILTSPGLYIGAGTGVALSTAASLIGLGTLPVFGPFIVAGVGVAGVIGGILIGSPTKTAEGIVELDLFESFPEELRRQLERLQSLAIQHKDVNSPLLPKLNSILGNAQELFKRISSKLDTQAGRLAAVNYTDTLGKLNKALAPDYYLDIVAHPNLWENSEKRLAEVARAVEATDAQIIQNIRQVNASQDIAYSVALDSLVNAVDNSAQAMLDGEAK
jgi:Tfp pilus assembly protein PilN